MTFPEAVSSAAVRFVRWDGRAPRSEYWWWQLFAAVLTGAGAGVDLWLDTGFAVRLMVSLALLLPSLSVLVRRLHDTGRSGWAVWWVLLPVAGPVMLLIWTLTVGHAGPNRFGPPMLGRHGSHGAERRFQPPPIYTEAPGYRPSDVPAPRRRPGWGGQDDDPSAAPPLPPFSQPR